MYSIIISFAVAIAIYLGFWTQDVKYWSFLWAVIGFIASLAGINYLIRRRIMRVMTEMQNMMLEGQKQIQVRMNAFQNKPVGDPKRVMADMEKLQKKLLTDALAHTEKLEPFRKWTPLFGRQINTTRMQFNYQMQEFKKVDELMPKCMIMDPLSGAMKMARQYTNKIAVEDIEKTFLKAKARLKYNQSTLLYALMAWIYVKNDMPDKAHTTLVKGCEDNENDTLLRNRDRLANNKVREFSNANLGDEWFALFLEQPKFQIRRQQPRMDGRPF